MKNREVTYSVIAVTISLSALVVWLLIAVRPSSPQLRNEPAAVYDVEGARGELSWALCHRGEAIVRGACAASEDGQETVSKPLWASGRYGWACLSPEPVRAVARCMGPAAGREGLGAATGPLVGAWRLLIARQGLARDRTTPDYYQWRSLLDSCLDAAEPEDEP